MSQQYLFRLSRTFPSHQLRPTMATSASFSFRLARKTLKTPPDPGRYSTYASMTRPLLSSQVGAGGIPHPSTYAVKPSEEPKTFESPSRPRPIYQRPKFATRELPVITTRWPLFVTIGAGVVSLWAGFLLYTTNQERLATSVIRQCILKLKRTQNLELIESLGQPIVLEPVWWMLNEPWVTGQINMPRGHIDVSIRITGSKGAGTLYFTSVRREKGAPFSTLRFKVITDDGKTIHLDPKEEVDAVTPPM
ncbi:hypothetical protein FRB95_014522 [Tulasnella sp. JGI-2019a]|nr:hypothetical protein FRB93_013423 [Tulasnella sp. JGI-2019a]KAG9022619.1 hypothetical protein FRB95_014522 [Tulasnella sp. JGI-2019a]